MKNTYRIVIAIALVAAGVTFSQGASAAGTIVGGSVQASSTGDLVAGKANAVYNVSFFYSTTTNATSTVIWITFPTGFSMTSSTTGSIQAADGTVASVSVTTSTTTVVPITSVATSALSIGITLPTINFANATTTFSIVGGVRNSTSSGITASSTIFTDSTGVASTTVNGVTISAGVATKLGFTTQPAHATSGIAFVTQPVVAAQDVYGNTSTTYAGTVALAGTKSGTLGGTISVALSSGVATFTNVKYTTTTDSVGTFQVGASLTGLQDATSSALTANIVATKLVFTTQPGGAKSGTLLSTQPVVTAEDADGSTDTDFVSEVTLIPTSTTAFGSVQNGAFTAVAGVATYANLIYNPGSDGEAFKLAAIATGVTSADSNALIGSFYKGTGTSIYYAPAVTPTPVVTVVPTPTPVAVPTAVPAAVPATVSAQQQLLNSLVVQLTALIRQASALGVTITPEMQAYIAPSNKLSEMTTNLSVGAVGQEVKMLQQFLNAHGFPVAESGVGSSGYETTTFGGLTRAALAKYQASVGISPASGTLGPITRAHLQTLGF